MATTRPQQKMMAAVCAAVTLVLGLAVILLAINAGRADHAPHYDPEGVVIYGDWGLYRPGHVTPWAHGPQVINASRFGFGHYYPSNRNDPGAHRRRPPVDRQPIPAEPYYRSWGAQSQQLDPNSASVYAPFDPPAVIYAPRERGQK